MKKLFSAYLGVVFILLTMSFIIWYGLFFTLGVNVSYLAVLQVLVLAEYVTSIFKATEDPTLFSFLTYSAIVGIHSYLIGLFI